MDPARRQLMVVLTHVPTQTPLSLQNADTKKETERHNAQPDRCIEQLKKEEFIHFTQVQDLQQLLGSPSKRERDRQQRAYSFSSFFFVMRATALRQRTS